MVCILAVDDCETNQFLSEVLITKFIQHAVLHKAYDGVEALDWLEKSNNWPDLILLDINMPRMNGHEFLENFSHQYDAVETNIIILPSSGDEEDKVRVMQYACVKDYILKPMNQESVNKVSDWVKKY